MIHIVCYLHGGDPGKEGRQLWSCAWPPCASLGLIPWPARLSVYLSVWSSGFHPPPRCSRHLSVHHLWFSYLNATPTPSLPSAPLPPSSQLIPSLFPLIPCLPLPRSSLSSPVGLCTEFFITSHLLPARAKDGCRQRRRQSDRLLTEREE